MVMITPRSELERKLDRCREQFASIPDRGFDSARRRAEIQDEINALLERLFSELD